MIAAGENHLCVDVAKMEVGNSAQAFTFSLNDRHKKMILEGVDMVGATMSLLPDIEAFEQWHRATSPWALVIPSSLT